MDSIIEKMLFKRLCLPINTDIDKLRLGVIKNKNCRCNNISQHIACVLKKEGNILCILSYGINIYDNIGFGTVHAEANAIENLPLALGRDWSKAPIDIPNNLHKKTLKKINILVIRTSKNCKIGISKPCSKCVYDLSIMPQKKGYIVKDIYYSKNDGLIEQIKLKQLINDDNNYISRYYRQIL